MECNGLGFSPVTHCCLPLAVWIHMKIFTISMLVMRLQSSSHAPQCRGRAWVASTNTSTASFSRSSFRSTTPYLFPHTHRHTQTSKRTKTQIYHLLSPTPHAILPPSKHPTRHIKARNLIPVIKNHISLLVKFLHYLAPMPL